MNSREPYSLEPVGVPTEGEVLAEVYLRLAAIGRRELARLAAGEPEPTDPARLPLSRHLPPEVF